METPLPGPLWIRSIWWVTGCSLGAELLGGNNGVSSHTACWCGRRCPGACSFLGDPRATFFMALVPTRCTLAGLIKEETALHKLLRTSGRPTRTFCYFQFLKIPFMKTIMWSCKNHPKLFEEANTDCTNHSKGTSRSQTQFSRPFGRGRKPFSL